jgi:hypothetical protein
VGLIRLIRLARRADLLNHIDRFGIQLELTPDMGPASIAEMIANLCTRGQYEKLAADLEKASAMSDPIGQAAMLALPDWRAELLQIEGAFARAHWLLLKSPEAFRNAEEIRYVDENQNSQRMWTGFLAPKRLEADTGSNQLEAIATALREAFGAGRFHIETIERLPPHDPSGAPYYSAYDLLRGSPRGRASIRRGGLDEPASEARARDCHRLRQSGRLNRGCLQTTRNAEYLC